MTLNALRVVPDAPAASSRPPRVLRLAQKLLTRD
jgi:hypothetical protein